MVASPARLGGVPGARDVAVILGRVVPCVVPRVTTTPALVSVTVTAHRCRERQKRSLWETVAKIFEDIRNPIHNKKVLLRDCKRSTVRSEPCPGRGRSG